jgi:CheY-like chemotaxis protein
MGPLGERFEMIDRLAGLDLDDSLELAAAALREEQKIREYHQPAGSHPGSLFRPQICIRVIPSSRLRLKQANNPIVLELFADRAYQDRTHRKASPEWLTNETGKSSTLSRELIRFRSESAHALNFSRSMVRRDCLSSCVRVGYNTPVSVMADSGSATILIVDDDEAVTASYAQNLAREGFDVRTAVTAEHGLSQAQTNRLDAIIVDLRMPHIDGLGFLRRLRRHEGSRETPVAIVTADYFLGDEISEEVQALGAELQFKPLWIEDLLELTRNLLKVTH